MNGRVWYFPLRTALSFFLPFFRWFFLSFFLFICLVAHCLRDFRFVLDVLKNQRPSRPYTHTHTHTHTHTQSYTHINKQSAVRFIASLPVSRSVSFFFISGTSAPPVSPSTATDAESFFFTGLLPGFYWVLLGFVCVSLVVSAGWGPLNTRFGVYSLGERGTSVSSCSSFHLGLLFSFLLRLLLFSLSVSLSLSISSLTPLRFSFLFSVPPFFSSYAFFFLIFLLLAFYHPLFLSLFFLLLAGGAVLVLGLVLLLLLLLLL